MRTAGTKTVVLDFDGVIHSYTSPWLAPDWIPDPPVVGALDFIKRILEDPRFDLQIYSSRSHQEGGIRAMQLYLKFWFIKEYGREIGAGIGDKLAEGSSLLPIDHAYYYTYFPRIKPPGHIQIDDRAHMFTGTFPTLEEIENFKPWNKK